MESNLTTDYRPPHDFNPYAWADAVKGLADAVEWFITEGPACESPMPDSAFHSLRGLAWAQWRFANELHEYLYAIEDITTLKLPRGAADFEKYAIRNNQDDAVREMPAVYRLHA